MNERSRIKAGSLTTDSGRVESTTQLRISLDIAPALALFPDRLTLLWKKRTLRLRADTCYDVPTLRLTARKILPDSSSMLFLVMRLQVVEKVSRSRRANVRMITKIALRLPITSLFERSPDQGVVLSAAASLSYVFCHARNC